MEMIVFKYGSYLFVQFEELIHTGKIVLKNKHKNALNEYTITNKDFMMLKVERPEIHYTLELKDKNDNLLAIKNI